MLLLCLGLNHTTAPVELREQLAYSPSSLKAALARWGCAPDARPARAAELVILSTCNRLELYAAAQTEDFNALAEFVSETCGLATALFSPRLYRYAGREAGEHLCRVAAGLDSQVLGEPQILGQVTEAYEAARGHGAAGPVLSALFRSAIRAGKRARTETAIGRHPASASSAAVRLAESVVGNLTAARVVVVGAGEMAGLAVEALRLRGVTEITVVNRTFAHARAVAERWGAHALTFERLTEALASADIVLVSTSALHFVITPELIQHARGKRPARPLLLLDIALPRNVDPEVKRLPQTHCYDLDDLHARRDCALAEREHETPRVEAIVQEETSAFVDRLRGLEIAPLVVELRAKAESIRRAELEKSLRRLPRLNDIERRHVEALTEALVNKLLHEPTVRLKAEAGNGHAAEYASAVRNLFALNAER